MVFDKIDNIKFYVGLSEDIAIALRYLQTLDNNVPNDVYQLNENVKAIFASISQMM